MSRRVQWAREALDDVKDQIDYIAEREDAAGERVAARLRAAGDSLGRSLTGRPGRMPGTFEKSVVGLPYVLTYSVARSAGSEIVSILRVVHTSRDWPADRWPA